MVRHPSAVESNGRRFAGEQVDFARCGAGMFVAHECGVAVHGCVESILFAIPP